MLAKTLNLWRSLFSSKVVNWGPTEDFWNLGATIFKEHLSKTASNNDKPEKWNNPSSYLVSEWNRTTFLRITIFCFLSNHTNGKFGEYIYLLSNKLLEKVFLESVFKIGETSYLSVFPEYHYS